MNTISSIQSGLAVINVIQVSFGAYGLKLNPDTALNHLSWSLAGVCDTLTLSVSPSIGTVPTLTNTSTSAIMPNLVGGTTYTFTITATKAGNADLVASLTTVWTSNMILFYTYNTADAKTDVSPNKIANWASGAAVYDLTLATTGTTYLATDFVKRGTASFRGSTNYGIVDVFTVDARLGYTMSYWLYFISQADGKHFHFRFPGGGNIMVRMNNSNMYVYNSVGGSGDYTTGVIATNAWTHITFSCTADGFLRVYLNGALSNTLSGFQPPTTVGDMELVQVGGYAFPHTAINGRFDDFRFYRNPMTAAQVSALYASYA